MIEPTDARGLHSFEKVRGESSSIDIGVVSAVKKSEESQRAWYRTLVQITCSHKVLLNARRVSCLALTSLGYMYIALASLSLRQANFTCIAKTGYLPYIQSTAQEPVSLATELTVLSDKPRLSVWPLGRTSLRGSIVLKSHLVAISGPGDGLVSGDEDRSHATTHGGCRRCA